MLTDDELRVIDEWAESERKCNEIMLRDCNVVVRNGIVRDGITTSLAVEHVEALLAEVYRLHGYEKSVQECHKLLDSLRIPDATGAACNDPECNSKLGHRIRVLVSQCEEYTRQDYRDTAFHRCKSESDRVALCGRVCDGLQLTFFDSAVTCDDCIRIMNSPRNVPLSWKYFNHGETT